MKQTEAETDMTENANRESILEDALISATEKKISPEITLRKITLADEILFRRAGVKILNADVLEFFAEYAAAADAPRERRAPARHYEIHAAGTREGIILERIMRAPEARHKNNPRRKPGDCGNKKKRRASERRHKAAQRRQTAFPRNYAAPPGLLERGFAASVRVEQLKR